MKPVVALDLDRTLSSFPATSRLYRRLFLQPPQPRAVLWALVMLGLMHGLWFWSGAVRLQRRIVMSLFSRVPEDRFTAELELLVEEVVADWRDHLGGRLAPVLAEARAVVIVSHCPAPLAERVCAALGFDGLHAIAVVDYLAGAPCGVFDKVGTLDALRVQWPGHPIWYWADDLVDLPSLKAADRGILVNATPFTRGVRRLLAPQVEVWT